MEVGYYAGNRERLYKKLCPGELLAIFSGEDVWKTGDECYPFFTERNFVYLYRTEVQIRRAACN